MCKVDGSGFGWCEGAFWKSDFVAMTVLSVLSKTRLLQYNIVSKVYVLCYTYFSALCWLMSVVNLTFRIY